MRVNLPAPGQSNVLPSAINILASISEDELHHLEHSKRHPLSIYRRSLARIAEAWIKALDDITQFQTEAIWTGQDSKLPQALNSYKSLLFALYEHLDASAACVRAILPRQTNNDPLLDGQFLDRQKLDEWQKYRKISKPYTQDRLGAVVNSIKHDQADMESCVLTAGGDVRSGYYIRGVLKSGALGPAPRIHHDGNSAFSFSRDMLIHYWNLYYLSSELSKVIRAIKKQDAPTEGFGDTSLNETFKELARRMAKVPLAFFPDEALQPCPLIRWNPSEEQLSIEMPGAVRPRKPPRAFHVRTSISVDLAHPHNKLPYFGKNAA